MLELIVLEVDRHYFFFEAHNPCFIKPNPRSELLFVLPIQRGASKQRAKQSAPKEQRRPTKKEQQNIQHPKCGRSSIGFIPEEVWAHTASFLTLPSRALLAISDCCNPQATQLVIAQSSWDTLDFGALEFEVASKLTDDNLASILLHIDARTNVKTLKLDGCMSIFGYGLEPLRRASGIEEIDLSVLNKAKRKELEQDPELDEEHVVPILSTLLPPAVASSSLILIHFPKHWRDRKRPVLTTFLGALNSALQARNYRCSNQDCGDECNGREDESSDHVNRGDCHYGVVNFMCTECRKPYCCDNQSNCFVNFCERCDERSFCEECVSFALRGGCYQDLCKNCDQIDLCAECDRTSCGDCNMIETCNVCDEAFCDDCRFVFTWDHCETTNCVECTPTSICSRCDNSSCEECDEVWTCVQCEEEFCQDCEIPSYFDCCGTYCDGCKSSHTGTGSVDVSLLEVVVSAMLRDLVLGEVEEDNV